MRKIKMITKAQRESHHSRIYWIWLFRAGVCIVLALLLNAWSPIYQPFAFLALSASGISWVFAWVHSSLEITCDKGDADCKDDHDLGKKVKKKRAMKKA